jgi:hypothetical protein
MRQIQTWRSFRATSGSLFNACGKLPIYSILSIIPKRSEICDYWRERERSPLFPNYVTSTHFRNILLYHTLTSSFFPDGGVGLVPKRGCLLMLTYYAFPRWYEFVERQRNDIDRGKPKNSEKNLSQCHFVHHKSRMNWPGCELGPPRWKAGD